MSIKTCGFILKSDDFFILTYKIMKSYILIILTILLLSFVSFGQSKESTEFSFPSQDQNSEFIVTFPSKPKTEAMFNSGKFALAAELITDNGFLRVECMKLTAKEVETLTKKGSKVLADYPTKYAESSGLTGSTISLGTDIIGDYAKLRGYKDINGIQRTFEVYFYLGKNEIITLYTGAASAQYPIAIITNFLNSISKAQPNKSIDNGTSQTDLSADKKNKKAVTSDAFFNSVLNGKAKSLPRPDYPSSARMYRASGAVNVQVVINEEGEVVSAKAISGHPALRKASEDAALQAKFTPFYLDGEKVRITGIIVYNFVP